MRPRAAWHPWAMVGPTLGLLVVFFLLPIGVAAFASLFSWDMLIFLGHFFIFLLYDPEK